MMVDTLKIARELKAADLPDGQAEAIAAAIGQSIAETAATKADVDTVRVSLKGEIDSLRHELKGDIDSLRHELKGEIDSLRHELKGEIAALRHEFKGELAQNSKQLLTWIMSAMVALGGIIIAVVKL